MSMGLIGSALAGAAEGVGGYGANLTNKWTEADLKEQQAQADALRQKSLAEWQAKLQQGTHEANVRTDIRLTPDRMGAETKGLINRAELETGVKEGAAARARQTQEKDIAPHREALIQKTVVDNARKKLGDNAPPGLAFDDLSPEEIATFAPTKQQTHAIEIEAAYKAGHLSPKDYAAASGRDDSNDTRLMLGQMNINSRELIAAAGADTRLLIASMAKSNKDGTDKVLLHQTVTSMDRDIVHNQDQIKQLRRANGDIGIADTEKADNNKAIAELEKANATLTASKYEFLRGSGIDVPDAVGGTPAARARTPPAAMPGATRPKNAAGATSPTLLDPLGLRK